MDKKGKNERNFFDRMTTRIVKRVVKKEIDKREKLLRRELKPEERKLAVKETIEQIRLKTLVGALAIVLGGGALGTGYALLESGEEPKQQETGEATPTDRDEFLSGIQVSTDEQEDEVSYTEEQEWIINEIDNLETKEDVLAWWKNLYIEEYEKMTGDDTLTTEDIKVILNNQTYVYKLDDGRIVTHGFDINATEAAIKADGQNYTTQNNVDVYKVTLDGKTIDSMTSIGNKVIPGENYDEMKYYDSVLKKIGNNITNLSFALMGDFETGRSPKFVRTKLKNALEEYYKNQAEQNKTQSQETPQVEDDGRE